MGLDQIVILIFAALLAITGPYVLVDSYGGWPIFWHDVKRRFLRKK